MPMLRDSGRGEAGRRGLAATRARGQTGLGRVREHAGNCRHPHDPRTGSSGGPRPRVAPLAPHCPLGGTGGLRTGGQGPLGETAVPRAGPPVSMNCGRARSSPTSRFPAGLDSKAEGPTAQLSIRTRRGGERLGAPPAAPAMRACHERPVMCPCEGSPFTRAAGRAPGSPRMGGNQSSSRLSPNAPLSCVPEPHAPPCRHHHAGTTMPALEQPATMRAHRSRAHDDAAAAQSLRHDGLAGGGPRGPLQRWPGPVDGADGLPRHGPPSAPPRPGTGQRGALPPCGRSPP
jgi:hypothetical protein